MQTQMKVVCALMDHVWYHKHACSVGTYQNNIFHGDLAIQLLIDTQGKGGGTDKHTTQC